MNSIRSEALRGIKTRVAASAFALLAMAPLALAGTTPAFAGTLDTIRQTGKIRLGYRADARPFSFRDERGAAAGYSVAICERVVDAVKAQLGAGQLAVEWVPVTVDSRFAAVQKGEVDLLCGAETVTLARRAEVSFSIPVFSGGIGALVRVDAPANLRQVLLGRTPQGQPIWRGSASQTLQAKTFTVVAGTTSEKWLAGKIDEFKIISKTTTVDSYASGARQVLDRKADVFFGDRALLYGAAAQELANRNLILIDRNFTFEPIALGLARGDEDFRLVVDRALSHFYNTQQFRNLYAMWFSEPDEATLGYFRMSALPE